MNQKLTLALMLSVVILGFAAFILYDTKTNNRLGFKKEPAKNWQWEDDWNKVNPIQEPKSKPDIDKPNQNKPVTPRSQITAATYAEAIKIAGERNMLALVFFEADWCKWCQKMKQETLPELKKRDALLKYVFVEVNTDKDRAPATKFGVRSLPSYVVTNAQEAKLNLGTGFKSVDQFVQWLGNGGDVPIGPPSTPPGTQPKPSKPQSPGVQPPENPQDPQQRKRLRPFRASLIDKAENDMAVELPED